MSDSSSEIDRVQRKMCLSLKLNVTAESSKKAENIFTSSSSLQLEDHFMTRRTSFESNTANSSKVTKTPSSIPRELVEESLSQSPSLARSPAMHEGFHIKDWKVERTPINTPDSVIVTNIVPKLSDDEEELEESDSVSETDPISKGSGTSSFLPSSVDVSEPKSGGGEKCKTVEMHLSGDAELASEEQVSLERSAEVLQSEASSGLVKPPAGFTDSPVRNVPPEFSTAEDQLCGESEILIVDQENNSSSNINPDVMTRQKNKSYNQEKFGHRDLSYHHPELVVCQRQGNSSQSIYAVLTLSNT